MNQDRKEEQTAAEETVKTAETAETAETEEQKAAEAAPEPEEQSAGDGNQPSETEKKPEPGTAKKDPKDTQIEELKDQLKRQMAEFDNFRKRTEKEKASMYEIGARDIIEKILPVLDNFERGLAAVPEEEKETPFTEGIEKIYKQFAKTLEDAGVEPIEAVGKTFDPNLHNAVMHIDDDSYGENEISQELQKGYTYRGSVVRHSMVQVAN